MTTTYDDDADAEGVADRPTKPSQTETYHAKIMDNRDDASARAAPNAARRETSVSRRVLGVYARQLLQRRVPTNALVEA
jgi:hypothetical protein